MSSYEHEIKNAGGTKQNLLMKIDISMMKYLWMANPLSGARKGSIPRFLRNIDLLKNFSDNELRIMSKYMHSRKFSEDETIFRQGEVGIGFYFIYSGAVQLLYANIDADNDIRQVLTLEEFGYVGEMALLQENHPRMATAIAKNKCELIGIFRPDLEHLIENHPRIAAKFIQSLSLVVADRLYMLMLEANKMQLKLNALEACHDNK